MEKGSGEFVLLHGYRKVKLTIAGAAVDTDGILIKDYSAYTFPQRMGWLHRGRPVLIYFLRLLIIRQIVGNIISVRFGLFVIGRRDVYD